jgi:hypothetical protein
MPLENTDMLLKFARSLGQESLVKALLHEIRPCGAKTRAGTPCKLSRVPPTWKRCWRHGGRSQGATSEEGKRRIGEAARKRMLAYWQKWREENA